MQYGYCVAVWAEAAPTIPNPPIASSAKKIKRILPTHSFSLAFPILSNERRCYYAKTASPTMSTQRPENVIAGHIKWTGHRSGPKPTIRIITRQAQLLIILWKQVA
jgi:hypothetical protein